MPRERLPVVRFKEERTIGACRTVAEAWANRTHGFADLTPPERMFSPEGIPLQSRSYAHYLFFAAWLNRSGATANEVIRHAARIAQESPWIIDPRAGKMAWRMGAEELQVAIPFATKEVERVEWWYHTMDLVHDQYGGDIFALFDLDLVDSPEGIWTAREELLRRFCAFKGVQHKIASLMILWFQDATWPKNTANWKVLRKVPFIPVDVWVLRLMRQFDCIEWYRSDHRDRVARPVADFLSRICLEHGINHSDLSQALWHIGSRIDAFVPKGNGVAATSYCVARCPAHEICVGKVRASREQTNRGGMGWSEVTPRAASLFHVPILDEKRILLPVVSSQTAAP